MSKLHLKIESSAMRRSRFLVPRLQRVVLFSSVAPPAPPAPADGRQLWDLFSARRYE